MKFPAICTLKNTGKTVVCSDAASFSRLTLEYGYPLDGSGEEKKSFDGEPVKNEPEVMAVSQSPVGEEQPTMEVTTAEGTMPNEFICSKCPKVCGSKAGLGAHERACNPTA